MSALPSWIAAPAILAMHEALTAARGGAPEPRDATTLAEILRRAAAARGEGETDPFRLAAIQALGVARDRPFGADSTAMALLVAGVFLAVNDRRLGCTETDAASVTRALATGELDASAYAMFLEGACGVV